jgi:aminoglycoside phosphotransferase (APT) family kinase protein
VHAVYRLGAFRKLDLDAQGLPRLDAYAAAYSRRAGRPSIDSFAWYEAFQLVRSACILQGIIGRVRDGTASSEHASTLADVIGPQADTAWKIAQSLGA